MTLYLTRASVLALMAGFPTVLHGQTANLPGASASVAPVVPASPAVTQAQLGNSGIGDIVVTAQRRVESVQKSSLAIQVVGGNDLMREGITNAKDLATAVPSVSVTQAGTFTQTNVRGVGDAPGNGLAQLAVAYSVDGVVEGQAAGISQNFYDLQRVEVLKGPQGTLYGRNATGGAINLLTNRPTHEFGGYVTGELGNYADKRLTGALNVPVTATLAVRGAFNVVDRDGYLSDGTDDDKRQAVRIQALWTPNSDVSLRIAGDYSHIGGKGGGIVLLPRTPGTTPWAALSDPKNNAAIAAGVPGGPAFGLPPGVSLHLPIRDDDSLDNKQWDISAEFNWKLGDFATLTLIPAYRHLHLNEVNYETSFRFDTDPLISRQVSLETRLGHQSNEIKWVLGGYYFRDKTSFLYTSPIVTNNVLPGFGNSVDIHSSVNRSLAVFGEATYSVTDRFRVIGGLRYTDDLVHYDGTQEVFGFHPNRVVPQIGKNSFKAVTWKGGAEYDIAPASMVFATASKGYKSGGFFTPPDPIDHSYGPEYLTSFDLGIRNRFFDNKLQVNLEAFYWKYRNQQVSSLGYTALGAISYVTRNVGDANPRGADLDIIWKPTRDDTFSSSTSFVHARYTRFNAAYPAALIRGLKTGPQCKVPATPFASSEGTLSYNISCAGAPLARTPKWSGTETYSHDFHMVNAGDLLFSASVTYETERYLATDYYVPEERAGGYVLLNADVTYTSSNKRWSITAFGRNMTNKAYYTGAFFDVLNGLTSVEPTFVEAQIGAPRTFGVRGTFKF